jgi:ATP-dependent Clp protease adaptor protein ClpS
MSMRLACWAAASIAQHSNGRRPETPETLSVASPERNPRLYKVILLNDDFTPREFVVKVLKVVFRMDRDEAYTVMLTAHQQGACVVAVFTFEIAEEKARTATEMGHAGGLSPAFHHRTRRVTGGPRLLELRPQSVSLTVPSGTMDINALVISGSDPGAVPGGSTKSFIWGSWGRNRIDERLKGLALSR